MAEPIFLISGATGATGGATAEQLLEKKRRVRVLAHRQDERSERLKRMGTDVVFGDFMDFESIRAALKGTQRAYFCYPIRPGIVQAAAHFAQAAKESGVEFIVNMSQKSARENAKSNAAQQHWLSERVFDWSGVPTGHIRPTYFMEWLLYLAPMIRQGKMMALFGTTGRHAPVAAEDQARVIVAMLENPESHQGNTYPLFGAVELRHPEIAAKVGRVLGREIQYQQVSVEELKRDFCRPSERSCPKHCRRWLCRSRQRRGRRELVSLVPSPRGRHRPSQWHFRGNERRHLESWRARADDCRRVRG